MYLEEDTGPLYVIFDRPMRLERNKRRNAKLSEGHGKWTNVFTGIEPETETKTIKPNKLKP